MDDGGPTGRRESPASPAPDTDAVTSRRTRARSSRAATDTVRVEAFDPASARPWRFHNRVGSGMDDASLDALAESIRRDGQQQPAPSGQ